MKEIDWLKSLDRPSRSAPAVDVTAGVMREVRERRSEDLDRVFPLAAALAALAGAAALAMAVPTWTAGTAVEGQEPLASLAEAVNPVLR